MTSNASKALIVGADQLCAKTTRTSSGATVFTLRRGQVIDKVEVYGTEGGTVLENDKKYRKKSLPAAGVAFEVFKQETLLQ